jgi:GntR family transcriptional regulator/MocR family aminotransferase
MPPERQRALLAAASARDFVVIEIDYELPTSRLEESSAALKSLDEDGRVAYAGSLSHTMSGGAELGILVGPRRLIEEARALRGLTLGHVSAHGQRTAALFLSQGHHDNLIRKLDRIRRQRREAMATALGRHLADPSAWAMGGTRAWVRGPHGLDGELLAREAARRGVLLEPGSGYFAHANQPCNFFRLGFSSIDESRIEPGIRLIAHTIAELSSDR